MFEVSIFLNLVFLTFLVVEISSQIIPSFSWRQDGIVTTRTASWEAPALSMQNVSPAEQFSTVWN